MSPGTKEEWRVILDMVRMIRLATNTQRRSMRDLWNKAIRAERPRQPCQLCRGIETMDAGTCAVCGREVGFAHFGD